MNTAYLSHQGKYTVFKFGKYCLRFMAPYSLERYVEVKEWDQGYLVVMTKYKHNDDNEEEYIDLIPILEDLYIDVKEFLKPIKEVKVHYD